MAREHARVKLSIWEDDDYRDLSVGAQHLYQMLLIHPQLNYAGVTDWRPSRLSGFARDLTTEAVEMAAKELSEALFIVIDESTEEVLIRSFVRSDGLLDSENMAVAFRKAHMAVSSKTLRGVVIHELTRLHDEKPGLRGWPAVAELLSKTTVDPSSIPSFSPSVEGSVSPSVRATPTPSVTPSVGQCLTTAPAPAPTPAPPTGKTAGRGTRLTPDWRPSTTDAQWTLEHLTRDGAELELEKFRNHWIAKTGRDATKLDWARTWRNWVLNSRSSRPAAGGLAPNGSTADQRVSTGMAVAAELRREESQDFKELTQR